jgi:hypothetical protein
MAWKVVFLMGVVLAMAAVSPADVTPQVLANDEIVKGRLLFGDPNTGGVGPWAGWNEAQSSDLWGGGLCGRLDISEPTAAVLSRIPGVPDTWWELLAALGGRTYLGLEIGAVDVSHTPQAMSSPGFGIALGPITYEISYEIFEGGRVREGGRTIAESGVKSFFGIQHVFRF